ncbi:MAG TPA: hypothetical protein PKD85_13455, partial [Saprospiraceae bacterium]|nr:hypothetical protein [Saprospiraceae bacterium]
MENIFWSNGNLPKKFLKFNKNKTSRTLNSYEEYHTFAPSIFYKNMISVNDLAVEFSGKTL